MLQYIRVDHDEGSLFYDLIFQFDNYGFIMSFKKGEMLLGVINGLYVLVNEMRNRRISL